MSDESPVIDLHSRTGLRADMATLARSHVSNARQRLGLSLAEFAEILKPLLPDYPLSATLIENWETTTVPPGDVVVAVGIVTRAAPLTTADSGADLIGQLLGRRFADVAAVFPTRSEFSSQIPPSELLGSARTVDIAGLSLNLLCQQFPDDQLRWLIENGSSLRCLFLEPGGESMASREREEGYPEGHLSALTAMNIQILSERVRKRLPDEGQARLQIATYDQTVRFNLIVVDDQVMAFQPYLPHHRGVESPTFLVRRQANVRGLFDMFTQIFETLWDGSASL